jgi:cytochrome P450
VGGKFYKDPLFYGTLGVQVMFTAISNDEHRRRRAPLNHFFSRRAVLELEDIVQEKVQKLCRRVQEALGAAKPIDLRAGTRAVSIDVITEYAFDNCWDHLDDDNFGSWYSEAVRDTTTVWWTFQPLPVLLRLMHALPEDFARKMSPAMNGWIDSVVVRNLIPSSIVREPPLRANRLKQRTREYVMEVYKQFEAGIKPKRRTIFHELLDPATVDEETWDRPSVESLSGEALSICTAAAETAGNAMETAAYHVVTNQHIYDALKKELRDAFPDPNADLDFTTLEKLPYLTGVVKEGQR